MAGNFKSDWHPILAGMSLGIMQGHGVHIEPIVDENGDYTPYLKLDLEDGDGSATIYVLDSDETKKSEEPDQYLAAELYNQLQDFLINRGGREGLLLAGSLSAATGASELRRRNRERSGQ